MAMKVYPNGSIRLKVSEFVKEYENCAKEGIAATTEEYSLEATHAFKELTANIEVWCDRPIVINPPTFIMSPDEEHFAAKVCYHRPSTDNIADTPVEFNIGKEFYERLYHLYLRLGTQRVEKQLYKDLNSVAAAIGATTNSVDSLATAMTKLGGEPTSWKEVMGAQQNIGERLQTELQGIKDGYIGQYTGTPVYWNSDSTTSGLKLQPYVVRNGDYISINTDGLTRKPEKENKKSMFNFDFGKITSDAVRMSMYGIAIKSVDGRYVSYDPKSKAVMDVDLLNMSCGDMLYKMPVALADIKQGDIIIHNKVPMYVLGTDNSGEALLVVDVREATEKIIYPIRSPFGFNYIVKVVSLFDMSGMNNQASDNAPFGNMWPLMCMSDKADMKEIAIMMMLSQQGKENNSINPMLFWAMSDGKNNSNDMLPLLLMMNQNFGVKPNN